ncbi:MAG: hypothetical protein LC687_01520 [Actinobacteria bacterium]|nr:hypothetical protein [Actinomycetota bacterium]
MAGDKSITMFTHLSVSGFCGTHPPAGGLKHPRITAYEPAFVHSVLLSLFWLQGTLFFMGFDPWATYFLPLVTKHVLFRSTERHAFVSSYKSMAKKATGDSKTRLKPDTTAAARQKREDFALMRVMCYGFRSIERHTFVTSYKSMQKSHRRLLSLCGFIVKADNARRTRSLCSLRQLLAVNCRFDIHPSGAIKAWMGSELQSG